MTFLRSIGRLSPSTMTTAKARAPPPAGLPADLSGAPSSETPLAPGLREGMSGWARGRRISPERVRLATAAAAACDRARVVAATTRGDGRPMKDDRRYADPCRDVKLTYRSSKTGGGSGGSDDDDDDNDKKNSNDDDQGCCSRALSAAVSASSGRGTRACFGGLPPPVTTTTTDLPLVPRDDLVAVARPPSLVLQGRFSTRRFPRDGKTVAGRNRPRRTSSEAGELGASDLDGMGLSRQQVAGRIGLGLDGGRAHGQRTGTIDLRRNPPDWPAPSRPELGASTTTEGGPCGSASLSRAGPRGASWDRRRGCVGR